MDELRAFLNSISVQEQESFARKCGTSRMYLRKVVSNGKGLNHLTSIRLEVESSGAICAESVCPDFDWHLLRAWASGAHKRKRNQQSRQPTAIQHAVGQGV